MMFSDKSDFFQKYNKMPVADKEKVILENCKGKIVLDIGCVGQDRDYNSDKWLHKKIVSVAADTYGVDIIEEKIHLLRNKGYKMFNIAELNASSKKFEIVIMADVIEHVDDPVGFLKYYSRFLTSNGSIFVTTPNAKRSDDFVSILFGNNYWLNLEHTMWLCPKTFAEITYRAGLSIYDFCWLKEYPDPVKSLKAFLIRALSSALRKMRRTFSANFLFVLKKNQE